VTYNRDSTALIDNHGAEDAMATVPIRSTTPQQVSHAVITAAMTVHTELGPGLLEGTYTACLQYELRQAGFRSGAQLDLPVVYRE
jgi:hypothetical protein